MKINQKKTQAIICVWKSLKCNQHETEIINQDEGEEKDEETDFLIKKN